MSIEKPANERLELYKQFKEALKNPADDQFFDADDLVIIYDQATDLDDNYVQLECLMRGFRYFPDNEELATRRGFYYYTLNLNEGVNNMLDNHQGNSQMWDILKVGQNYGLMESDQLYEALDKIVKAPGKFDDETAIQFVSTVDEIGEFEWLKENEKALRKKTEYLPSLLYELFIAADNNNDPEYALKLLEELTEIEPFNVDFWVSLSQTQLSVDNLEGAMAAADYAMAIASDDVNVVTTKGTVLGRMGRYAEVVELVDPLLKKELNPLLGELKVRALMSDPTLGKPGEAQELLTELLDNDTNLDGNRPLLELALELNIPDVIIYALTYHWRVGGKGSDEILAWARKLYHSGAVRQASVLLEVLNRDLCLDDRGNRLFYSSLYATRQYEKLVEVFERRLDLEPKSISADLAVGALMSYLRLGRKKDCKRAVKRLVDSFPLNVECDWILSTSLETIGFSSFISTLNSMLEKGGEVDLDILDIFHLPGQEKDTNNDNDLPF